MSKIYKISLILIALLSVVETLSAHGLGMHLYLGSQTPEVWRDFDPDFYHALTSEDSVGVMTRKFYYIGLMLPDLIDTNTQKAIRSLLITLHDTLPTDTNISLGITISRKVLGLWIRVPVRITADIRLNSYSPLRIYDETYTQVQQLMYFNGEFPNTNLTKLHEMVEYARRQRWSTVDKAMIYGAYMHVIHDLYAHMVLQPALFGYPYAIEADSAFGRGLLYFPELYYELFTETYIPDWSFMEDLYKGYVTYLNGGDQCNHFSGITPYSFFTNEIGTTVGCREFNRVGYQDWQILNFSPVQKFVEAAQATGYAGPGLTQERLESYLHGAAILLYMYYGYNESDQTYGGMFSHTNWNIEDIIRFVASPFLNQYSIQNIHVEGNAGHVGDILIEAFVDLILWSGVINLIIDPTNYARNLILRNPMLFAQKIVHLANGSSLWHREWTYFLEGTQGMDEAIDSWENDSIVTMDLKILRREIGWWDLYCQQPAPSKREFYEGEVQRALNFADLYKLSVEHGQSYLDYESWSLARKAGVLGGMWEIDLRESYYHQPGVLSLSFSKNNNIVYTSQDIPIEGPPAHIDLSYDLITFGGTKVLIESETGDTIETSILDGTSRHRGNLTFNAQDAVNSGVDTVHFVVKTARKDDPTQFATMFSSDYRDVYNTHSEIYTNPYYQHYFANGNPVRSADQSPAEHPEIYWPYILPLNRVLTVLNEPTNLAATVSNDYHRITLTWTDRSNYEDGYIIQKRGAGGDWETIASLGPNTSSFTDEDVQPFSDYEYRIWAYNSTTASDTIILPIATDKIVADSALAPNSLKQMVFANNKLVWVYELNGGIYMKTSSDYGMTWSAPQLIGSGVDPSIDAYYSKIAAIWYDTTANVLKYVYGTPEQYSVYDLEGLNYDVHRTRASVALAGSKTHIARYLTTNHDGSTEVCLISFPSNSPQSFTRTVIYGNGSNRYHVLGPYINDQQVVTFVIDSIYGIDTSIALCCDTLYVYKGTSLLQRVSRKGKIVVSNPVYAPNFYDENLWAAAFNDTVVIYGYLWDAITMDLDNCSVPAGSDWLYMTLPTASSVTNAYLIFAERDGNLHLTEIKRGSKPLDTWHISSDSTLTVTDVVSARAATVVPTTDPTKIYLAVLNNRSQSDYDGIVSYKWFDVDFTGGSPYSNGERLNLRTGISLKSSVTSSDKLMLTLSLAESEMVSLRIYNINGRILKEIPGKHYTAGIHRLEIDLRSGDRNSALPSGIYFLKADIGNKSFVKKLVVIK